MPRAFELCGESGVFPVKIPYRGRHVIKWVKVTKGYRYNCGYGFWVGNTKQKFYKTLKIFGIKGDLGLRNDHR